jgi:uncharacterized protein with HEPN domain
MRSDQKRLLDIIESVENIERYSVKGKDAFFDDELIQVWVIHHIQIIGEAASKLSSDLRDRYPEIMWSDIISMRNILVHQYFGIDLNMVWDTVITDIPVLKQDVKKILENEEKTCI